MTAPLVDLAGEHTTVLERMIVAPDVGVFRPLGLAAGSAVAVGDVVGVVEGPGKREPVRSPVSGRWDPAAPRCAGLRSVSWDLTSRSCSVTSPPNTSMPS